MSCFLTWNRKPGKLSTVFGPVAGEHAFLAMAAGEEQFLLHSAPKRGRERVFLPCNVVDVISAYFYHPLQVISGFDLFFMSIIKRKMKDHLFFPIVLRDGHQ